MNSLKPMALVLLLSAFVFADSSPKKLKIEFCYPNHKDPQHSVYLSWEAVSKKESEKAGVLMSTKEYEGYKEVGTRIWPGHNFTVEGLKANTTYYFKIRNYLDGETSVGSIRSCKTSN